MSKPSRSRRTWRLAVAMVAVVVLGVAAFAAERAVGRWIHGRVEAELTRSFGRPVRVGRVGLALRGLALDRVWMPRRGNEPADPFVARRAWLSLDWWQYARTRVARVTSASVEDIHIDVPPPHGGPPQRPWPEEVVRFAHDGLRHFEMHRGTIVAYDAGGHRALVIDGADGSAELTTWSFTYRFDVRRAASGPMVLTSLRGSGRGNPRLATLDGGRLRLAGSEILADARYDAGGDQFEVRLSANALDLEALRSLAPGSIPITSAQGRIAANATLRIAHGDLASVDATVRAAAGNVTVTDGTWSWSSVDARASLDPGGTIRANGTVRLDRKASASLAGESPLRRALTEARARAGGVGITFDLSFPRAEPARIQASGHVHLDDIGIQLSRTLPPLRFHTADADVRRVGNTARIEHVSVHDGALSLRGEASVTSRPRARPVLDLDAIIDVSDLHALRTYAPRSGRWPSLIATLPNGRGRVVMHTRATIGDPRSVRVEGTLEAHDFHDDVHIPLPSHTPLEVPVHRASARFAFVAGRNGTPDRFEMRDIQIDGPMGLVTGTADLVGDRYHVVGRLVGGDHKLIDWLVPGNIGGGTFAGTIDLRGNGERGVEDIQGTIDARDAQYVPPGTMRLVGPPIQVAQFATDYHWRHGDIATLDHVVLRGRAVRGTGSFEIGHGSVRIRADLHTHDAGRVTDYWPALHGLLRGGNGDATLDITIHNDEARGTLAFEAQGGAVSLSGGAGLQTAQPIERGAGHLVFGPNVIEIRGLSLRGPQLNLDMRGAWPDGKTVHLSGRVWLTPHYTAQLIGSWHWLARAVGIRSISSNFNLFGTVDRVMLSADITHSLVWRLGHGRIPRNVQEMLTTRRPINQDGATGGGPTAGSRR